MHFDPRDCGRPHDLTPEIVWASRMYAPPGMTRLASRGPARWPPGPKEARDATVPATDHQTRPGWGDDWCTRDVDRFHLGDIRPTLRRSWAFYPCVTPQGLAGEPGDRLRVALPVRKQRRPSLAVHEGRPHRKGVHGISCGDETRRVQHRSTGSPRTHWPEHGDRNGVGEPLLPGNRFLQHLLMRCRGVPHGPVGRTRRDGPTDVGRRGVGTVRLPVCRPIQLNAHLGHTARSQVGSSPLVLGVLRRIEREVLTCS